eukprot:4826387-Pleurochrysis_carterae.AAC.6
MRAGAEPYIAQGKLLTDLRRGIVTHSCEHARDAARHRHSSTRFPPPAIPSGNVEEVERRRHEVRGLVDGGMPRIALEGV